MGSGIYKITNKINGKLYVGSSVDVKKRWKQHVINLNNKKHHSIKLQRSWSKHGEDSFVFEVLELCDNNNLIPREQYYLDKLNVVNEGYNINPNARNCLGRTSPNKGIPMSDEQKRKIGKANKKSLKGKKLSEETKKKISEKSKSLRHTEETKKRISEKLKNRVFSIDSIKKMSESRKGRSYEDIYGVEKAKEMRYKKTKEYKEKQKND